MGRSVSGDADPDDPGPAITIDQVHAFLAASRVRPDVIVDCFTPEARLVRTRLVHQRAISAAF
ncbi:hypothetical protein TPA0910_29770 [Streptomyces hygroscopicus subsp. sporocinereus]|uniref:Uncharacterized protein n=1 Tax=Streptomyces hygroscopicus TaxID=1912 RepID=A0ABQ3TYU0_STRHY|nr:hypothetical protein [Streptomyces hygroscopicus]GHJ28544.1 hypothetical protein TPA0910_29770 [Streptomyces hygroscopicus]